MVREEQIVDRTNKFRRDLDVSTRALMPGAALAAGAAAVAAVVPESYTLIDVLVRSVVFAFNIAQCEHSKDEMDGLFEVDQYRTKTLNDEIKNIKDATLAMKADLPLSVAEKVSPIVFKKFSPIDENFTGLEEIEAVYINFTLVRVVNFMEVYKNLQQGLDKGTKLLIKLQERRE